jgi:glycosyltransferase involved in cell wall biosynthesis
MTSETGSLVPPGDPAALAGAVAALLADEPRRRACAEVGRRLAVERYSWDRIAARLLDVYDHVAAAPEPARARISLEAVPA